MPGTSGLEGLAGTPERMASPSVSGPGGGLDDLAGMGWGSNGVSGSGGNDLMNGFAGLDMNEGQPLPPQRQLDGGGGREGKGDEDLLGLF